MEFVCPKDDCKSRNQQHSILGIVRSVTPHGVHLECTQCTEQVTMCEICHKFIPLESHLLGRQCDYCLFFNLWRDDIAESLNWKNPLRHPSKELTYAMFLLVGEETPFTNSIQAEIERVSAHQRKTFPESNAPISSATSLTLAAVPVLQHPLASSAFSNRNPGRTTSFSSNVSDAEGDEDSRMRVDKGNSKKRKRHEDSQEYRAAHISKRINDNDVQHNSINASLEGKGNNHDGVQLRLMRYQPED
ncbi:hypothetical protein SeMB42_g07821, partial [Synchytrium endobioticum]